jgi:hypothetical protein
MKMKRTSLFAIAICAFAWLVPQGQVVRASDAYIATVYRARWSPYTHSLIFGDVAYSPYAFRYSGSGLLNKQIKYTMYNEAYGSSNLVVEHAVYSPYAFGYDRSGLITDPYSVNFNLVYAQPYRIGGYGVIAIPQPCYPFATSAVPRSSVSREIAKSNYQAKVAARRRHVDAQRQRRDQAPPEREFNGQDVIAAYLTSKNIPYRTNRTLSIDNKLMTIDFQLTDKKLIIKYWNPEAILALKQQQDYKTRLYDNYMESYRDFCSKFLANGGELCQIVASDNVEVLAKLLECDEFKEDSKANEQTTVAKAGEETAASTTMD